MVRLKRDTITFEVMMKENAMDHVVLAVARSKASKAMLKEEKDLQRFANVLAWTPAGRKWVSEELAIVAESKEVAGDLITEAVLDQVSIFLIDYRILTQNLVSCRKYCSF